MGLTHSHKGHCVRQTQEREGGQYVTHATVAAACVFVFAKRKNEQRERESERSSFGVRGQQSSWSSSL